jgi:hypothetical protein
MAKSSPLYVVGRLATVLSNAYRSPPSPHLVVVCRAHSGLRLPTNLTPVCRGVLEHRTMAAPGQQHIDHSPFIGNLFSVGVWKDSDMLEFMVRNAVCPPHWPFFSGTCVVAHVLKPGKTVSFLRGVLGKARNDGSCTLQARCTCPGKSLLMV